jgi:hypothetical protein
MGAKNCVGFERERHYFRIICEIVCSTSAALQSEMFTSLCIGYYWILESFFCLAITAFETDQYLSNYKIAIFFTSTIWPFCQFFGIFWMTSQCQFTSERVRKR